MYCPECIIGHECSKTLEDRFLELSQIDEDYNKNISQILGKAYKIIHII